MPGHPAPGSGAAFDVLGPVEAADPAQLRKHPLAPIRDEHLECDDVAPAGPVDVDVERVAQGSGTVTGTGGS